MRKNAPFLAFILGLAVVDQVTKAVVAGAVDIYRVIPVIPGFFNITRIHNSGAIFGILSGSGKLPVFILLTGASLFALGFVIYYFIKTPADRQVHQDRPLPHPGRRPGEPDRPDPPGLRHRFPGFPCRPPPLAVLQRRRFLHHRRRPASRRHLLQEETRMHPILVKLGPLTIHSYGFLMALGVGLGLWFLYVQAGKQRAGRARSSSTRPSTPSSSRSSGPSSSCSSANLSYYVRNPKELFSLARSGGVFQGGLTFGVIFALWYFRRKKIPTWKVADLVAPALALGHGFGRIGCFAGRLLLRERLRAPLGGDVPQRVRPRADRASRSTSALHPGPDLRGRPQLPEFRRSSSWS